MNMVVGDNYSITIEFGALKGYGISLAAIALGIATIFWSVLKIKIAVKKFIISSYFVLMPIINQSLTALGS